MNKINQRANQKQRHSNMEQTDSCRDTWIMLERRKETSAKTGMNDPWTWTTPRGLTLGDGMGRGGQRRENWDNYNRITIKNKVK